MKGPASYRDTAHQWLIIDFDCTEEAPGWIDELQQGMVPAVIAERIPPEMLCANIYWRLSSGAGIKPGVRVRLACWLERKITGSEAKRWLKAYKCIDKKIYSPAQPIYLAAPIFDGIADPVAGVRSGTIMGWADAVTVPEIPPEPEREHREAPEGLVEDDTDEALTEEAKERIRIKEAKGDSTGMSTGDGALQLPHWLMEMRHENKILSLDKITDLIIDSGFVRSFRDDLAEEG